MNVQKLDDLDAFFFSGPILIERETIPFDSGEETDEEDHEERIKTSWHHRALLGDENRILYTDFQDTDWDEMDRLEAEKMASPSEEDGIF